MWIGFRLTRASARDLFTAVQLPSRLFLERWTNNKIFTKG